MGLEQQGREDQEEGSAVKIDIPVPFERLAWFQGKLDWG